jgi:DNA-binding GntR family transcriptional regulator
MKSDASETNRAVFRPLRHESLVDMIHAEVRRAILNGDLRSGSPVRESAIAESMEVSRAPVREALRRLEQSSLVVKPSNRSYAVTQFTERDVYELATLRIALESLAAQEAMRDPRALEATLREKLANIARAVSFGDEVAELSADREFHDTLVQAAGNRRLLVAYETLRDQIQLSLLARLRTGAGGTDHVARHEQLLNRVVENDVDGFVRELQHHIAPVQK